MVIAIGRSMGHDMSIGMYNLGIQIRNMKMVFNFYGTWRWVMFEKLMMKIYDFFYSAKLFSHPNNIVQKSLQRWGYGTLLNRLNDSTRIFIE